MDIRGYLNVSNVTPQIALNNIAILKSVIKHYHDVNHNILTLTLQLLKLAIMYITIIAILNAAQENVQNYDYWETLEYP